jgi:hypothetical protein
MTMRARAAANCLARARSRAARPFCRASPEEARVLVESSCDLGHRMDTNEAAVCSRGLLVMRCPKRRIVDNDVFEPSIHIAREPAHEALTVWSC